MKKMKKYQKGGSQVKPTTRDVLAKPQKEIPDTTSTAFPLAKPSNKPSMDSFDPRRAVHKKPPVDNPNGWATPSKEDRNRKAEDLFKNPYKKGGSITSMDQVQKMYSKKKK
jgi:hypothetical protein